MSTPRLEACGPFVHATRSINDEIGEAWLVADCSSSPHGAEYARLFAAAPDMLAVLIDLTNLEGPLPGNRDWHTKAMDAITKATKPRFPMTYCSQCGKELGPGDHGVSHCENHGG